MISKALDTPADRLAHAMDLAGFPSPHALQRALPRERDGEPILGTSRVSVNRYLYGGLQPHPDFLAVAAPVLRCSPEWIATGQGDAPAAVPAAVPASEPASEPLPVEEESSEEGPLEPSPRALTHADVAEMLPLVWSLERAQRSLQREREALLRRHEHSGWSEAGAALVDLIELRSWILRIVFPGRLEVTAEGRAALQASAVEAAV